MPEYKLTERERKIVQDVMAANQDMPAVRLMRALELTLILARPKRSAPGFGKKLKGPGNK